MTVIEYIIYNILALLQLNVEGTYNGYHFFKDLIKNNIGCHFDQVKRHIKEIEELQSGKLIITLWIRWKKPVKLVITLDSEDVECAQDIENTTANNYMKI